MIYTKTNPVGIDKKLKNLNLKLHTDLLIKWSMLTAECSFFERVYRNSVNGKFIPEGFTTSYKDVLFNSALKCTSFFYLNEEPSNLMGGLFSSTAVQIVQCNLVKLYPSTTHRADEEIRKDIMSIYLKEPFGFRIKRISYKSSEVFVDFDMDLDDHKDMQPFLSLRFESQINFRYDN